MFAGAKLTEIVLIVTIPALFVGFLIAVLLGLLHDELTIVIRPDHTSDIGTVWEGDTIRKTFTLVNVSKKPHVISSVAPTCGCTSSPLGDGTVIQAGASVDMPLRLDSTGLVPSAQTSVIIRKPTVAWIDDYRRSEIVILMGEVGAQWPRKIDLGSFLSTILEDK